MTHGENTGYTLPGRAESYWLATTPESNYPALSGDINVDVAIIGGGTVGITSAFLLKEVGMSVAIIEADRIIKGATGYTTAKITSQHNLIYDRLISKFGRAKAKQYAEANQAAIDRIEYIVRSWDISCDFAHKPAYVYAGSEESAQKILDEVRAARSLGLPASFESSLPLPFETYGAVRFNRQAQFHPRKYLCALAREIEGDNCYIFEKTRALGIEGGEPVVIKTDRGTIRADDVIQATHYPILDKPGELFKKLSQSMSYVLGLRIQETFPDGMFINAEEPTRSLRSQPAEGGELVLAVGDGHPTGSGNPTHQHYKQLEDWVRAIYNVRSIDYHWLTEDVVSEDGVPLIGRLTPDSEHFYLATGFGKWGMTTGTAAAVIITDMILGRDNPWVEVYDPSRFREISELIAQEDLPEVEPGQGVLVEKGEDKMAVYRDPQGILYTLNPACRHMGCTVSWNDADRTWDCHCHGSRYNARGEVIQSPAVYGLLEKKVKEQNQYGDFEE
ncbi:Glycine/D-amino acid oxidase [Methanosarcina thermophila]|jgi:glycine/D-amino acid oxidase-like deaminating enzyme/nitrite reductase/ring-hydroxylating ferredoxin subunit|uniref:Glycine/D-amino acid oxidase n=3 Tax=Methanosarcina thermophila TaxID=2210 RepID=A0A1I6YMZ0_METTE|nr:FAD-dependent oxidoreductase [Methanosarcina thermophila]ALK05189.1 MAG: (2Fe-2S)-binding protein [Methanosarcina sp. 795]AKB13949.1 Rieske [2Fe-2S] iron-sulfur protein [Methanosarcina thermophila TM-1]AKB15407.1 Rieske [2Fe-2S] iron-sulfur protein [Methanosarcina thermophila CHTI-55]NLU56012.1 FAD-dependent oxidoreductase [Methanosarcina thermophila]SFT51889.1 Glycine/D-amino acid oxidase [Methanosarcina thermophila]